MNRKNRNKLVQNKQAWDSGVCDCIAVFFRTCHVKCVPSWRGVSRPQMEEAASRRGDEIY
jgi:hypothetical protein